MTGVFAVNMLTALSKKTLVVAIAIAALAPIAKADPITISDGTSAIFTFTPSATPAGQPPCPACPLGTAQATFSLNGNVLTIEITNTATGAAMSDWISGLAFSAAPDILVTNAAFSGGVSAWEFAQYTCNAKKGQYCTDNGGLGVGGFEIRSGLPGGSGLGAGDTGTIVLTIDPSTLVDGGFTFSTGGPILHIQNLPNGESQKPVGDGFLVPEPASLVLMGSGLIGAGSFLRKKLGVKHERG